MVSNTTVSLTEVREKAEKVFCGGDLLRQAGVIVRDHIDKLIDDTEYNRRRDALAATTNYPSILKAYMDGHYQRGLKRPDKIDVTICD